MSSATGGQVLVLNAGSSSVKFALFDGEQRTQSGQVEGIGARPRLLHEDASLSRDLPAAAGHTVALDAIMESLALRGTPIEAVSACGHRIVHGGARFVAPVLLDQAGLEALQALRALAPLHNRFGLDAIEALRRRVPGLPQVACFDTAFHAAVPQVASRFALPEELHEAGYRRYGFHGLNFEYVSGALSGRLGRAAPERLLIFHLGNGCSIAAVLRGQSVATTMGYSTLDGLVMGTRCGSIDPGVLLSLQRDRGLGAAELEELLYRRSGLLGLSGHSSDMRDIERVDDVASRRAMEHFSYWAARHAGSLLVALGGLDGIAFSGGIGVGSAKIRTQIIGHLAWLGVRLDAERNACAAASIAAPDSSCPVWIVPANEELAIARHVRALLN